MHDLHSSVEHSGRGKKFHAAKSMKYLSSPVKLPERYVLVGAANVSGYCWTTTASNSNRKNLDGSPFEVKVPIDDEASIQGVGDLWETFDFSLFEVKKRQHCLSD